MKVLKRLAAQIGLGLMVLFLILSALFSLLSGNAEGAENQWGKWGAAPHSASLKEACLKAPSSIDGTSLSKEAKAYFKKTLGTTCKGGKEVWLTPHMQLRQMWSGPDKQHRSAYVMNNVTVAELSVLKSPDGRPYRKGSVAEAAKALSWTFTHEGEGRTEVLYLPFVCFNWSWTTASVPLAEKCVEYVFNAPPGGKFWWGYGTITGPLPPDECNAQRQGDGRWTSWYGECSDCLTDISYIKRILGPAAEIPFKFMVPVVERQQTLRFSTEIWTRMIYVCLEDASGKQTCGVMYMRPEDWQGRYRVVVPDDLWLWQGDSRCPSP